MPDIDPPVTTLELPTEPEPAAPLINRGTGFMPVLVRQLAGIIALRIAQQRGITDPVALQADLGAIKSLSISYPTPGSVFSTNVERKIDIFRRNVRDMVVSDTDYMAGQVFELLELLDMEFLGVESDGGTHP